MKNKNIFGPILLIFLFILLVVAGTISYQSIDWTVLQRIEKQELILPTQTPATATSSASQN